MEGRGLRWHLMKGTNGQSHGYLEGGDTPERGNQAQES